MSVGSIDKPEAKAFVSLAATTNRKASLSSGTARSSQRAFLLLFR